MRAPDPVPFFVGTKEVMVVADFIAQVKTRNAAQLRKYALVHSPLSESGLAFHCQLSLRL